ncbi:GntR family transcriptional regulator [Phytoactinopolyspora halotolerans]|uniref:GntR family transcriptional regulator n=1 Tax=Phytoactinopolyspora halotolerans TaxID=1981512 RepID=A0A6L9SE91_9ACTN|nr:GntR family transcriptional regulator [Phytoactinopolyspora halotolerans]NEE03359.1 GntR family transcriptional regulator [Phytoactinopolyspora halotolerans]
MSQPSSIRRIKHASSLRAEVERALSAAIVSGELEPGALVSVPTLAAQFAVSATPVREAMLDLEKRGFVEPVRNKGFRVTHVGEDDLRQVVQVRRWLEVPAIGIVARSFPADRIDHYRELADRIVTAAAAADFPEYLAADTDFHLALMELTRNGRLVDIVADLRRQTRLVGLADMKNTVELKHSAQEHHALLDLLVEGRADDAEALMHQHIGHILGWWAGRTEN